MSYRPPLVHLFAEDLSNWMSDAGFLKRVKIQITLPGFYGALLTYGAKVTARDAATGAVSLDITGTAVSKHVARKTGITMVDNFEVS